MEVRRTCISDGGKAIALLDQDCSPLELVKRMAVSWRSMFRWRNPVERVARVSWLAVQVEFLERTLREDFLGTQGCFPRVLGSPFRLAIASALVVTA